MTGAGRSLPNAAQLTKQVTRILKAIAAGERRVAACADGVDLTDPQGGRPPVSVSSSVWTRLRRDDLVVVSGNGDVRLTDAGRLCLRRLLAGGSGFAEQHQHRSTRVVEHDDGSKKTVLVNDKESPIAWLHRHRGRDGKPFLSEEQFAAGERLRRDFTRAQLGPSVTSNWSLVMSSRQRRTGGRGHNPDLTAATIGARSKVRAALTAVGPELAGVLLDICCFLKGVEQVERERHWPARSGKTILGLALSSLQRHYAGAELTKRPAAKPHHWGTDDYRPRLDADLPDAL